MQRRSPVAFDPRIRGYRWGQIYTQADGVYWTPARMDLDYDAQQDRPGHDRKRGGGARALRPAIRPRLRIHRREPHAHASLHNGFHADFERRAASSTNGGQIYGRETISGGESDWGFRGSYGDRNGSDYEAGNGQKMPSGYHNQDAWGEVELRHQSAPDDRNRLSAARPVNTEYPGQFFDIDYLVTYGFQARLVDDDPAAPWTKLVLEGWYNRTIFTGDTLGKHDPDFPTHRSVSDRPGLARRRADRNKFPQCHHKRQLSIRAVRGPTSGLGDKDCDADSTSGPMCGILARSSASSSESSIRAARQSPLSFDTNMPHAWLFDPGATRNCPTR